MKFLACRRSDRRRSDPLPFLTTKIYSEIAVLFNVSVTFYVFRRRLFSHIIFYFYNLLDNYKQNISLQGAMVWWLSLKTRNHEVVSLSPIIIYYIFVECKQR